MDVEVKVDPLLNNYISNNVVLLLLPSLGSCSRITTGLIYYISDLFLLKHSLGKIGPLKPIFKVTKLLSLALAVVVFICHFDNDLEEGEKCSTGIVKYTPDPIT